MFHRKVCFTLIEMMVVISVIAIVMTIIGINTRAAIKKERFRAGVEEIEGKLQLAQDLMLIMDDDVNIKIYQEKDGVHVELISSKPINKNIKKLAIRNKAIQGISSFAFEDLEKGETKETQAVLDFLSRGTKMSRGILHLYASPKKDVEKKIALIGYPRPIATFLSTPEPLSENDHPKDFYPEEIFEILKETPKEKTDDPSTSKKK